MMQPDRNAPTAAASGPAPCSRSDQGLRSMPPGRVVAAPADRLSGNPDKDLGAYQAHDYLPVGPGSAVDRLQTQSAFGASHNSNHDWLLADAYPGFLSAGVSASPWEAAHYVYSSDVAMQHIDRFDDMFASRAAETPHGLGVWSAAQQEATASDARRDVAPGHVRRSSAASTCAESSCSSACVYGEQCDLVDPCELGDECRLDQPCELGDECELDQPCDASDCDDEPTCIDECCPVYTCEETKAAATLASFVGADPQPSEAPCSLQRSEHGHLPGPSQPAGGREGLCGRPATTDAASVTTAAASTPQDDGARHIHCDGSTAASQAVIQHLIENHNDQYGQSCVRPCLLDQPWNYAFCPMTCLLGHPQLHGQDFSLPASQIYTGLDDGNSLMSFCDPGVLASDCNAHWTSGDQLLEHWHMQHRALLPQPQYHQLLQVFGGAAHCDERIHAPYVTSREGSLTQGRISLDSSPATPDTAPSPLTPVMGASVTLSSAPTTPAASSGRTAATNLTPESGSLDAAAAAGVAYRCLWCDTNGGGFCGKVFDSPKELNSHVIGNHVKLLERSEGGYVCGWQGCKRRSEGKRGFPQKSKIERHVQTHTGEKPYECPTCHITFSAKQALDQHELIHKGSKPLPCGYPGCDKTFRQQSARTMHMRTHTKVKPLACNICGRRFSESSNLSKHRRTHAQVGAFECGHQGCSKTFHRLDQLRRHQKTHETKHTVRRVGHRAAAAALGGSGEGSRGDGFGESASISSDVSESEPPEP